ncbi:MULTISPECIES: protein YgfX [Thiorhodovibrio]|uniref:protein YgfX n=1 Tax=Thiorhodovibrio TaxID=61593 RepID=UPI001914AD3A|nr:MULTISPECIES: protein YgfX [Thiorhodovibrio]WPL10877.1 hypothetical protein Thiosp_00597 [Thiorhodovibrio litoralis]
MQSSVDLPPLQLRPVWSRQLLIYWALVHFGALALVTVVPLSPPLPPPLSWSVRLGLVALVGGSAALIFANHLWRRMHWSIMEAVSHPDAWELVLGSGETVHARLLGSSFVGQRLMVLNFALGRWRRLSLTLAPDSLDAEPMRRLRADLRAGLRVNGPHSKVDR